MEQRLRKFALSVHLTLSIGWIGAVVAYLTLVASAWTASDPGTVLAAWVGMEVIGWYAIVPLAVGALATGIVMGVGTHWGIVRHYWVVFSLVLTVVSIAVLIGHMPAVSSTAAAVSGGANAGRAALYGEFLHAGGGLVVLLVIVGLNVYKPRGLTRFGTQKR